MKQILICPNAFKGCLTARQVSDAISKGLEMSGVRSVNLQLPIADGGDGTLPILSDYLKLSLIKCDTIDVLGRPIEAQYGWSAKSKIGVVELAEASGIRHLSSNELAPFKANTFGTGILLNNSLEKRPAEIYLTVGGSASIDGGMGILEALGVKFIDASGLLIKNITPTVFSKVVAIDAQETQRKFKGIKLNILCDVETPLLGSNGAVKLFGPQKGASEADILEIETRMRRLVRLVQEQFEADVGNMKYGGAAGGVPAFLYGILGAHLADGGAAILNMIDFDNSLINSDIVITGEGKIDSQTLLGKGPGLVMSRARKASKYVVGFCGENELNDKKNDSFNEIIEINKKGESLSESLSGVKQNLIEAARLFGEKLKA